MNVITGLLGGFPLETNTKTVLDKEITYFSSINESGNNKIEETREFNKKSSLPVIVVSEGSIDMADIAVAVHRQSRNLGLESTPRQQEFDGLDSHLSIDEGYNRTNSYFEDLSLYEETKVFHKFKKQHLRDKIRNELQNYGYSDEFESKPI